MVATTRVTAEPGERTIVMSREFDAPRPLVFRAYTDPEAIPQWWGPRRYTTIVDQMDVRPGGAWRYVQHDADGNQHAFRGEYREVVPSERLVYTFEYEGMPGHIAVDTVTFEERNGRTLVTVHSLFDSVEDRDGMLQSGAEEGALETWDRLAEYLAALPVAGGEPAAADGELVIAREFDAPRDLVWRAWTSPEHVARWYGPSGFTLPTCEIDLRVGGRRLVCMRGPNGQEFWTAGVYREIVPPERLVYTDVPADELGNVAPAGEAGADGDSPVETVVTITLEDLDGRTRMTLRHSGLPAGPGVEGAGAGWSQSFDRLAGALARVTG